MGDFIIPIKLLDGLSEHTPRDVAQIWPHISRKTKIELLKNTPQDEVEGFKLTKEGLQTGSTLDHMLANPLTSTAVIWHNLSNEAQINIIESGRQLLAEGQI